MNIEYLILEVNGEKRSCLCFPKKASKLGQDNKHLGAVLQLRRQLKPESEYVSRDGNLVFVLRD